MTYIKYYYVRHKDFSMNSKLTLRLDEDLIKTAKKYSIESGKSLSKIVADLFSIIEDNDIDIEYKLSPKVRKLKGSLCNFSISEEDYKKHLEQKHL